MLGSRDTFSLDDVVRRGDQSGERGMGSVVPRLSSGTRMVLLACLTVAIGILRARYLPSVDVSEYHRYAESFVTRPIGTHWPREYPAMAMGLFLLPMLLPVSYPLGWALVTAGLLVSLLIYGGRIEGPTWVTRFLIFLDLGAIYLWASRYDLWPAAFLWFTLLAAERKRWGSAWVWMALGTALKWFPVVLAPLVLIDEWRTTGRWRWDRLLVFLGVTAILLFGLPALTNPSQALSPIQYSWRRPTEIESTVAGLLAWVHPSVHLIRSFGSLNVQSAIANHGLGLGFLLLGVGLEVLVWKGWAAGRWSWTEAAILAVGILIITSKVYSAQYWIWMVPLVARSSPRFSAGWAVVAALTTAVYPISWLAVHWVTGWTWTDVMRLAGIRDVLLGWGLWRTAQGAGTSEPHTPPLPTSLSS